MSSLERRAGHGEPRVLAFVRHGLGDAPPPELAAMVGCATAFLSACKEQHAPPAERRPPPPDEVPPQVVNPKTALSQFKGGLVWGVGMALQEHTVRDPRTARAVTPRPRRLPRAGPRRRSGSGRELP